MSEPREISPQLTLFAAASPARTSAAQESRPGSPAPAADSGMSSPASSQSSAHASSSSRTSPRASVAGCRRCGLTCASSDTEPAPSRFLPLTSEPHTSADGSSFWPTATASPYGTGQNGSPGDGREQFAGKGAPSLNTLARQWPTPMAADGSKGSTTNKRGDPSLTGLARAWPTPLASDSTHGARTGPRPTKEGESLKDALRTWPTPMARDRKGKTSPNRYSESMPDAAASFPGPGREPTGQRHGSMWPTATATDAHASRRHGYMIEGHSGTTLHDAIDSHHGEATPPPGTDGMVLNPAFVEALMGFPPGWTSLPSPQIWLLPPSASKPSGTR